MVRLSIGIEHIDDLLEDLNRAWMLFEKRELLSLQNKGFADRNNLESNHNQRKQL